MRRPLVAVIAVALLSIGTLARAAQPYPANKPPAPPTEFAFVLNNGYGQAFHFPTDLKDFENLLVNMAKSGFNTIYCVYTPERLELCRKHGVKMMIDVLAWHKGAETGIRRPEQRDRVKAICTKVRNDAAVWGYNLWNEKIPFFGRPDGKDIDWYIKTLKGWDSTHPIWVGSYRNIYANAFKEKPGIHGYYDYHWQRGFIWHFADLGWYRGHSKAMDGHVGRWLLGSNYNLNSYTLNTSIAFGLKVCIWFIGGPFDKKGNIDPKHRFFHLIRIGQEHKALYKDLMDIGRPLAVYSTPTTMQANNRPKKKALPKWQTAFPEDYWMQVKSGEVIVGFFQYKNGTDAVWLANHNAFAPQDMALELKPKKGDELTVELLDRKTGKWRELPIENGAVSFKLGAAGGELLRVKGRGK